MNAFFSGVIYLRILCNWSAFTKDFKNLRIALRTIEGHAVRTNGGRGEEEKIIIREKKKGFRSPKNRKQNRIGSQRVVRNRIK